jgi:gliding motility-associated-like protein
MRNYFRVCLIIVLTFAAGTLRAQVPTNADCLGAIPVCQSVYTFSSSVHGEGNYTDIPDLGDPNQNFCPGSCIADGEQNTTWFIFTTQTAGLINFTITPINSGDDYDWAVYNLTTGACSDIYAGGMQVSCNYCMNTGPTGPNGLSPNWCEGPNGCSQFNAPIPTAANQTYVLMVDNFSSTNNGYTLDFTPSSASIFDNIPPQMTTLQTPVPCGASSLVVTFSENILCNTVSTGDFTVTGPGGPYAVTYVSAPGCLVGGTMDNTYTLTVVPSMNTAGSYTVNLVNTAGSVSDLCGNIAPPASLPFTITGPSVSINPNTASICSGSSTLLTASGATTYTWAPATGLSGTTGASVTATPLTTTTYTVEGLVGSCSAYDTVTVFVNPGPVLSLTQTPPGAVCPGSVVTLDVSSNMPGTTYSWSTGGSGSQITPTVNTTTTYTVTGTASGCSSSSSITVNVTPAPVVSVSPANPVICNSQSTLLVASGASTYTWSPPTGLSATTGDSVTANPAATITYTVTGSNGGCTGSTTTTVSVNAMPTATVSGGGNICNDGVSSVTVTITLTGTPPWNITYTNGVTPTTVNGINTSPYTFSTTSGGIYTVTSITDANCPGSANGAALVNVYPLPAVTLAALTPVCLNTPIFALSGGSPAGGNYSGPGVVANNFNAVVAGVGTHNIVYTYTDGNGCSNRDTNTITVNALPVVDVAAFAGTCLNTPAFPLTGGTPAGGTYSGTGVSLNNFDPSVAGIGSHVITYSYTDGNNCTNTDTASINVQSLPVVNLAPLASTCVNATAYALTGGTPAGGTYSGTGVSGNQFDPTVTGAGTFNITYTYTDPATTCSNSAAQPLVVNTLPVITHSALGDVCVSTPPFLLSGGNPAGGTYSGLGVTNNIFDPDSAGVGAHVVTYSYTDPMTQCTDNIPVNINVVLDIPITVAPVTSFICEGGSANLTASGATNYIWSPSTGLTSTVGSAVIATPPSSITYTVTGSNPDGCSGTTTAQVNIYPPIDVNFLAIPQDGCKPLDVTFLYTPSPMVEDSSWVWNFGDIISEDNISTLEDPTHTFIEEGNYTVTLTVTSVNGCTHSGTMPVNVYGKPQADFFWTPEVGNMENPQIWFADASIGANYWYWNFGDPASGLDNESNLSHPVHMFSDSGSYEVILIVEANHGCADTVVKWIIIYPQVLIFVPNAFTPDNNLLNDTWGPSIIGVLEEGYQLEIWDRWGKNVWTSNVLGEQWDGKIAGKRAPAAVYVWVLKYKDPAGKDFKRRGQVTLVR